MGVTRIDTARTTSLPVMDRADAFARWGKQLGVDGGDVMPVDTVDRDTNAPPAPQGKPTLKVGTRVSVYWTDMDEWFEGTYQCCRMEAADGGGTQRASCIVYDATGPWASCSKKQSTFWHCLDDEQWKVA